MIDVSKRFNMLGAGFMDVLTKEQRHKNMQRIRSRDTRAEKMLRLALWHHGIRYRKNYAKLPGKPDIALTRQKIAVFVDGDFWHARWHEKNPGEQVGAHKRFWQQKLARNVERDKEVNEQLLELGWLVLRFWEGDIKDNMEECIRTLGMYL